jgi:leucyl aminopeptidase
MKLPLRLRLLVPVAENSVSGTSLRPSDVIKARNGKTTEVTNTDAEGRLILADAISYACEANPSIIIDFATLTGAARAALGEDLPALFSNNDTEAMALWNISIQYDDPMWILPLWKPYSKKLKSSVADLVNSGDG